MLGIVDYQPQRGSIQKQGDLICSPKIHLVEGLNEVDIDEWEKIRDQPAIKKRIEAGVLRPTFASPTIIQSSEPAKNKKTEKAVEEFRAANQVANSVETSLNQQSEIGGSVPDPSSAIRPDLDKTIDKKK